MSLERVKEYFEQVGLGSRIIVPEASSATVAEAAQALGCQPCQIAKTMSFLVGGAPVLIVTAGDAKVDNPKYKAFFHEKAKMIPANQVESCIGHAPGGVCPFAVNEDVPIYLDISMKRFEKVHTAGGIDTATICVGIAELEKYSGAVEWVDVCKGWYVNEH